MFGDWGQAGSGGANPDQANLMQRLAASGARFAVSTGDIGYPSGSQTNYGDLQQTGSGKSGVFGPQFWAVPGRSLALFPAAGNHAPDSTFLTNWPQPQAVAGSSGRYQMDTYCCLNGTTSKSYASAWYAFDAGPARYYVLDAGWPNSNVGTADIYKNDYDNHWTPSSPEYQWLAADLASHPSARKFAFMHFPMYSDNATETSDLYLRGQDSVAGLLSQHAVDIVFSGHAHIYERNLRQPGDSFVSYLTGGGGGKLAPIGAKGCSAFDAYGIGWCNSKNQGSACGAALVPDSITRVFHFLLVTVQGTRVTVAPTDELGRTFDVRTYDF